MSPGLCRHQHWCGAGGAFAPRPPSCSVRTREGRTGNAAIEDLNRRRTLAPEAASRNKRPRVSHRRSWSQPRDREDSRNFRSVAARGGRGQARGPRSTSPRRADARQPHGGRRRCGPRFERRGASGGAARDRGGPSGIRRDPEGLSSEWTRRSVKPGRWIRWRRRSSRDHGGRRRAANVDAMPKATCLGNTRTAAARSAPRNEVACAAWPAPARPAMQASAEARAHRQPRLLRWLTHSAPAPAWRPLEMEERWGGRN